MPDRDSVRTVAGGEGSLPPAEKALLERLLPHIRSALAEAGTAAGVAADTVANMGSGAWAIAQSAGKLAADYGARAVAQAGDAAGFATEFAREILDARRLLGKDDVAQVLFRTPTFLRDEVKRLSLDQRKQMDELLTEGVVDLLIKYGIRQDDLRGQLMSISTQPSATAESKKTPKEAAGC